MRWERPIQKLRWYLREHRWRGIGYFAADMAFWRLRNLRHLYRVMKWKGMARRRPSEQLCFEVQGLRLYLNPLDLGLSAELAIDRVHEPILTDVLQSLLHPGMTVVDVGANLGYFALLAARRVAPNGRVFALEPFPASYQLLRRNIEANGFNHVVALPVAAGRSSGKRKIYVYPQANWNSFFSGNRKPIDELDVDVCTLDNLLTNVPRVDLIRMDVEGAELDVLYGSQKILGNLSPKIVIEVHPTLLGVDGYRELLNLLSQLGYDVLFAWGRHQDEVLWLQWLTVMLHPNKEQNRTSITNLEKL
ncbi:MAG: FkbM family methyltransferase, partial [Armatimonadota bacterium]|nr:FkbM family methyltransferase [Armatimonadota bacterium]